jgi:hypothetical protein
VLPGMPAAGVNPAALLAGGAAAGGTVGAPDALLPPGGMKALRVVCCYHVAKLDAGAGHVNIASWY